MSGPSIVQFQLFFFFIGLFSSFAWLYRISRGLHEPPPPPMCRTAVDRLYKPVPFCLQSPPCPRLDTAQPNLSETGAGESRRQTPLHFTRLLSTDTDDVSPSSPFRVASPLFLLYTHTHATHAYLQSVPVHELYVQLEMNKGDLETYQVQLQQVEVALVSDPDSDELKDLLRELKELISLTEQALAQQVTATSSSASKKQNAHSSLAPQWKAGDECLAKYSSDGQWYPARIASVGGSVEDRVYTIVFKVYNSTELLNSSSIKAIPPNYQASYNPYLSSTSAKRKLTKVEEDERERKKKKNEKKLEVRAQKAKEQNEKQATWQKFAKKSEKKGIHIAGVAGTSIFKTPDNPLGKGARSRSSQSPPIAAFLSFYSRRNRQR